LITWSPFYHLLHESFSEWMTMFVLYLNLEYY
jgi:hypothetical protein